MNSSTTLSQLKFSWWELRIEHRVAIALLLASGMLHLPVQLVSSYGWEDPISFRKPILFGLSTGLTLWSCLWVSQQLQFGLTRHGRSNRINLLLDRVLSLTLVLEVLLITLQPWRQTRSHFSTGGGLNALIELFMLLLITVATCIIIRLALLSSFTNALDPLAPAMRRAIRSGMSLLVVSCLLGFLITGIGKAQIASWGRPEIWGASGVLKFPHGAALHAIQYLVVLAWFARFKPQRVAEQSIVWAARAHWLWLAFALQQTFRGMPRFELDWTSAICLFATVIAGSLSLLYFRLPSKQPPQHQLDAIPSAGGSQRSQP